MIEIKWLSPRGPKLSDHNWGDLCKDESGEVWLIGDAVCNYNIDEGCGCCSESRTYHDIVAYCSLLNWDEISKALGDEPK